MAKRAWKKLLLDCAAAARDKKAFDINLLDLRGLSSVADYFLIVSASSQPHAAAVCDAVEETARLDHGLKSIKIGGRDHFHWTVIDLHNIIVHIFDPAARSYYQIERLWGDAKKVKS